MVEQHAVTIGGIRMSYAVVGDPAAAPMVLLHALGERGSDWTPVTEAFAERYRVYAPDLRGHGDTDWPGKYSFQLMRDDVIGLLDHLGLRQVILAGHSMGGVVAYLVAIVRPDLVARLIIEDAAPPSPRNRPAPGKPAGPIEFDWPVVPAIRAQVDEGDPETWGQLKTITAPTLIIGGGPESHIPHEKLEDAASRIPTCELITVAAGHDIHTASPEEFKAAVLTWLAA